MNQRNKFSIRNDNIRRFINYDSRSFRNCIRFNSHNNIEHEITKSYICFSLLKNDLDFITEARLFNGQLLDIFITDLGLGIEIMNTETDKKFESKLVKYPDGLRIIKVNPVNWEKELEDIF